MKTSRKLEYARWMVAGAIFGAAVFGVLFSSFGISWVSVDHHIIGAVLGGLATACTVKACRLV